MFLEKTFLRRINLQHLFLARTYLINNLILFVAVAWKYINRCARHDDNIGVEIDRRGRRCGRDGIEHHDGLDKFGSLLAVARTLQARLVCERRVVGSMRADAVLVGELAQLHVHAAAKCARSAS